MTEKSISLNKDLKLTIIAKANSALTREIRKKLFLLSKAHTIAMYEHLLKHWGFASVDDLRKKIPADFRTKTSQYFKVSAANKDGRQQTIEVPYAIATRLNEDDIAACGGAPDIVLPKIESRWYDIAEITLIARGADMHAAHRKFQVEAEKLTSAIYDVETQIGALINGCKTSKQLRDAWPEGAEHYAQILREHGDAGYTIAVTADALRKSLKSLESLTK